MRGLPRGAIVRIIANRGKQSLAGNAVRVSLKGVASSSWDRFATGCLWPTPKTFSTSTAPPPPDNDENADDEPSMLGRYLTPEIQTYLMIGGGAVATLGVAQVVMSFTSFFTHLTPMYVGKLGFWLGFGTATAMSALGIFAYDTITIRANPVYQYALGKLRGDSRVLQSLGDGLTPGNLTSYRLDSGRFEFTKSKGVQYRPPRVQMIFDIHATGPPYRTGLCTIEASKETGAFPPRISTSLLKLDYEDGDDTNEGDQTVWLIGDEATFNRVSQRSGISMADLASYIHINRAVKHAK